MKLKSYYLKVQSEILNEDISTKMEIQSVIIVLKVLLKIVISKISMSSRFCV